MVVSVFSKRKTEPQEALTQQQNGRARVRLFNTEE